MSEQRLPDKSSPRFGQLLFWLVIIFHGAWIASGGINIVWKALLPGVIIFSIGLGMMIGGGIGFRKLSNRRTAERTAQIQVWLEDLEVEREEREQTFATEEQLRRQAYDDRIAKADEKLQSYQLELNSLVGGINH